jgi:hypothetical protein
MELWRRRTLDLKNLGVALLVSRGDLKRISMAYEKVGERIDV